MVGAVNDFTSTDVTMCGKHATSLIPVPTGNVNIVLKPLGTGSFGLSLSDGTVTGGNCRGNYAVDLQRNRGSADQVASGGYSFLGGCGSCKATGSGSAVIGGYLGSASGTCSAVVGGDSNNAKGSSAVVCGGYNNLIDSTTSVQNYYSFIGGGISNIIGGSGACNSILAGTLNSVRGSYNCVMAGYACQIGSVNSPTTCLVGGTQAFTDYSGCFVWADNSGGIYATTAANQFKTRCSGGAYLRSSSIASGSLGVKLLSGSSYWASYLPRSVKENISKVDPRDLLHKVSILPVSQWESKHDECLHIGPMGEEFNRLFDLEREEESEMNEKERIDDCDADAVNFGALQGALFELEKLEKEVDELEEKLKKQKSSLSPFKQMMQDAQKS